MSVKRTEDSLMKLRRNRQSLLPVSGMSDDNKIRLQLALDIEEYHTQVRTQGTPGGSVCIAVYGKGCLTGLCIHVAS